jgi:hypothetical protein
VQADPDTHVKLKKKKIISRIKGRIRVRSSIISK